MDASRGTRIVALMSGVGKRLRIVSTLLGLTIVAGGALAGDKMEVRLNKINKTDKFEVMLDDKSAGRFSFFMAFHGTYKQTRGGILFEGVNNKGQGTGVLFQGNGPVSGYDIDEKEGDTYKLEWTGECFSLSGPDGKPVGYCAGGAFVAPGSGTGRFAGLTGGGNWRGHSLPNGDFDVEENLVLEK
jgi:hypothetical protein